MSISKSPSLKPQKGSSAKLMTPAGSGSRPGASKYPIKTSAPANPKMHRSAPNPLK